MKITPKIVKEFLKYEPESGDFFWLPRDKSWFSSERGYKIWTTKYEGKPAGWVCEFKTGYSCRLIGFPEGNNILAHRVAWAWMTGRWPVDQVDHIDQNPLNNSWLNLRECDNQINHQNRPRQSNNKSGFTGVCWHKAAGKWHAKIKISGKSINLGLFDDIEEAIMARSMANKKYGFLDTHGASLPSREYHISGLLLGECQ